MTHLLFYILNLMYLKDYFALQNIGNATINKNLCIMKLINYCVQLICAIFEKNEKSF